MHDLPSSSEPANPWYVIRTFQHDRDILNSLRQLGLNCFIPMKYHDGAIANTEQQEISEKELTPVVHGYIFVEKSTDENTLLRHFSTLTEPFRLLKRDNGEPYEVSAEEMRDFRMLCDPTYSKSVFISAEQAEARIGKMVTIVRGRFRGIKGKLCQIKGKYYFIKHVAGLGVMIRITRWFCRPDE